jgi:hypothetical protein
MGRKLMSVTAVPYHKVLVAGFQRRQAGLEPRLSHMRYVVDKTALRQVSLRVFRFLLSKIAPTDQHSSSSGDSIIGYIVIKVVRGLSLTLPQKKTAQCPGV